MIKMIPLESDYSVYQLHVPITTSGKQLQVIRNIIKSTTHYNFDINKGGDYIITVYLDEISYNKYH